MQPEHFHGICSHFYFVREDIDAFFRRIRIHITIGAQFLDGAHHAVAFHPAQLPFLDLDSACHTGSGLMATCYAPSGKHDRYLVSLMHVIRTGNDLYGSVSDVYLADDELIRVGMPFNLADLTDDDLIQVGIQLFISLYLCSG